MPAFSIEDLRRRAAARLPRAVMDYIEGGSTDEKTLRSNIEAFDGVSLMPRCLVDVARRSQSVTVLGREYASPLIFAPIGLAGLAARRGEIVAALAARDHGIGYCLSTFSICSIEDVAAAGGGDFWFQLYVMRDRGLTRAMIERARAAGCGALCLTVDVPIQGPRERDVRNGLTVPPRITRRNAFDMLRRLPWIADVMLGQRLDFGNFAQLSPGQSIAATAKYVSEQFDSSVSWRDFEWFRSVWDGKLVLKGVLHPDDARKAVEHGADAIVVSNHGGRQLDGAPASITMLPRIVEIVAGRAEILFDGGIRRGGDVVKALALGANACLLGRAMMYGLGAGGGQGVAQAIQILKREIDTALGLAGVTDIRAITSNVLLRRGRSEFDPRSERMPPQVERSDMVAMGGR